MRTYLAEFVLSSAARKPRANFKASSFAQKCMKNKWGESFSIWLCRAVTAIPLARKVAMTGFTSLPSKTKSPVIAARATPVG